MRKIMYFEALLILHKKRQTLTFSRRHRKRSIWFTLKRKSFCGLVNAEHHDHCSFYTKTENFGFVLFHLKSETYHIENSLKTRGQTV